MRGNEAVGGSGEPWNVMYINAVKRLVRSTAAYPLRRTLDEIAGPCFPAQFRDDDDSVEWINMRACSHLLKHIEFFIDGERFWMAQSQTGRRYPTALPPSGQVGVIVSNTHPHFDELKAWIASAHDHDAFVGEAKMYLNRMLRILKHPKWVEVHWPKLASYVGEMPMPTIKQMIEPRPRQLQFDYALNERIEVALTAASLMPEDYELSAWIGRYGERPR